MLKIDIQDIPGSDNQFDCIICCHVLEHVSDDRKAMRELFRVLKPDGWVILQSAVDYNRDKTFEDPNVTLPDERERVFGERDLVRKYGEDYKNRIAEAGFAVKIDNYAQQLGKAAIRKYGLVWKGENLLLFKTQMGLLTFSF